MQIDKNPIILNNTFEVLYNIDITEDVAISINGLIAITAEDITNVSGKIITISSDLTPFIDFTNDTFAVYYTAE